jgi:hypothetical protein
MSSQNDSYSLVTLNDRVVPGFAGILRFDSFHFVNHRGK